MIDQLQNLLADAEAAIELDPENEALVGQRTFFENQLERTQLNASFVQDRLRPRVANGDVCYLQRLVFAVDDALWDDELYFWKNAMGHASDARGVRPGIIISLERTRSEQK